MHIFQMTAEISALGERFFTFGAGEGSLTSVFAEVIPQIATLFEYRATTSVSTSEIQFYTHGFMITNLDGLMPITRDSLKCLGFWADNCYRARYSLTFDLFMIFTHFLSFKVHFKF